MEIIQVGNQIEISNGEVVLIYELMPNGDLIKQLEMIGTIVTWEKSAQIKSEN